MSRPFTPRGYQVQIIDYIIANKRCALWVFMGAGKTVASLVALDTLNLVEDDVYPALVLAPLRVAKTTWPDECAKWDELQHLTVVPIVGSEAERRSALRTPSPIYSVNYEQIEWLTEYWGDKWPYKTVVADEATKLKGFRLRQGGRRARALGKVSAKIKHFIELTGTSAPNGLIDLYGQLWFVDAGERLGRTFSAFTSRWFKSAPNGFGLVPMPHAQAEIQDKLRDVCLTVKAEDWFDLKAPIVNDIYVELPMKARKHYAEMEKDMFTQLSTHAVEAFGAAARTQKCLQIANGAMYVGDGNTEWEELHSEKLQALASIVEEAGGVPVLVAYNFKSDLARLMKAFPKGRKLDADPKTIKAWNAGKIPLLFAHPASAGHGLNLQDGGNILVYFALNWNFEEHAQILERVGPVRQLQAGHNRNVFVHRIIARDTVDELVLERLTSKREVQDILLDAMRVKGFA